VWKYAWVLGVGHLHRVGVHDDGLLRGKVFPYGGDRQRHSDTCDFGPKPRYQSLSVSGREPLECDSPLSFVFDGFSGHIGQSRPCFGTLKLGKNPCWRPMSFFVFSGYNTIVSRKTVLWGTLNLLCKSEGFWTHQLDSEHPHRLLD